MILNNFDYRCCFICKQRIFIVYVYISLASSGTTLAVIEDSSGSESEELCSIPVHKKRKRRDLHNKTVETDNEDTSTSITQGTQETDNEDTKSTPNTQAKQGKKCYL